MCRLCSIIELSVVEDRTLPLDTVEMRGDRLFVPDLQAGDDLWKQFAARYAMVHTSPPSLIDRTTGKLVDLPLSVFPWLRPTPLDRRALINHHAL